ncbi:OB-fold nucleic acid binding domain-containing protein isoform 3 [Tripterygium wilfordii]|uniref:OB-fold nucleic acid binding domain-containing protein isoform 3 n=1 Tax=Tripterygium wilfordii TaxID=458696 RepID=A0A7J7E1Z4_TRIWF|nr:aminoacyl tRNA synthase complex-interacting multifunctional protein 1 [Tripterygium wilfordii]KAF5752628.1 OB-fold nucleic acid binding domain-containing protein isoform 3 [Tripterygium wilfordii]
MSSERKELILSSLCKHLLLDPKLFLGDIVENDIKGMCTKVLKSSGNEASLKYNDEIMKWISFAESFPDNSKECVGALNGLNEELAQKSVLLGNGFTPSVADSIVYAAIHSAVIGLSSADKEKLRHVIRWADYIQSKEDFEAFFEKIILKKSEFEPLFQGAKSVAKVEVDLNAKKTVEDKKHADKSKDSKPDSNIKKSDAEKKAAKGKEAAQEKKKAPEADAVDKDKEVGVSLLSIQVGLIRKAWKHPSADSLLVEEIDVGEAKLRQVVSGLAKYCTPEVLTNRRVVLITNVKPGKLRDVMSEGLVLCASNDDHTLVEPLLPPEGAKVGERVSFSGIDGKPEDVLNPKKKQLEKITPHLFTDDNGVATFKGIPFMTSGGPCKSSIPKASIK